MEIWKKNPLVQYDNQLGKIRQEKLQLKKRLEELDDQEIDTLNNRRDAGIKKYMSNEKRKRLLDEAETLGFSHEEIQALRVYVDNWNQDIVTNAIIDELENLEKYIEKQAPHKKNPLYKLGGLTNSCGGNENDD